MTQAKHFPAPVTTMFARRVKPGYESQYETWLKGITQAASAYPGSQGTTILRPSDTRNEYIAISHFDSAEHLEGWLVSPERKEWLERLNAISLDHEEVTSLTGMERWFTLPNRAVTQPPARYKSAFLVFLGLYPLVLLLGYALDPFMEPWPRPLRLLVSLLISVPIMVWVIMPWLTRLGFGWLYPRHRAALTKPVPKA